MVQAGQEVDRAYRLAAAVRVIDPNQVRVYDIMGWCLFKQGKFSEALAELEKARSLMELKEVPDPAYAVVYEHLAEVFGRLRDSMMAREMFSRALVADPSRAEEWRKRAQVFGGTLA
jgi:Tfp pilus assembly protein PilF